MGNSTKIFVTLGCILILGIAVFTFLAIRKPNPVEIEQPGTSVVVLVDFSKSFAASIDAHGRIIYGLRNEDGRALKALSEAVAELASLYWEPPVKVVWGQIQSWSITGKPICAPLETIQKLIKPEGSVGTREEIERELNKCASTVIQESKSVVNLSAYTDVSGAISMASEFGSNQHKERVLVMLSDFHEDLQPGTQQAVFQLSGERVILLHRPGADEPANVDGYIGRIQEWKERLLRQGASVVAAIPVFSVTQAQLRVGMHPENVKTTANLTVIVDMKDNVLSRLEADKGKAGLLPEIGKTLAELSRDWKSKDITTLWVAMGSSGFGSKSLPPIEFTPSLIKKSNELSTIEDFKMAMEEMAIALPRIAPKTLQTDIGGSVALATRIEPAPASEVLIVISDFVDNGSYPATGFNFCPNTKVIMIHVPSPQDRVDPNGYAVRRAEWEKRFRESGAMEVYQFPLVSFTASDLRACFGSEIK